MVIELSGIVMIDGISHTIRIKYDKRTCLATVDYPAGQGRSSGCAHASSIGAALNFITKQLDGSESLTGRIE